MRKKCWKCEKWTLEVETNKKTEKSKKKTENWMFWIYDCYWMMVSIPKKTLHIHLIDAVFSSVSLVFSIRIASCRFFAFHFSYLQHYWKWCEKIKRERDTELTVHRSVVRKWHVNLLPKAIFSTSMLLLVAACMHFFLLLFHFELVNVYRMHRSIDKIINDRSDRITDQQKRRETINFMSFIFFFFSRSSLSSFVRRFYIPFE